MISNTHAKFVNIKRDPVRNIRLNGSGKSTLLQVVIGTLKTSLGKVKTLRKIGDLLETGSSSNPEPNGQNLGA
jgi:ABC-type polysaccharide/polyol phosphate transport system ATPase subunit